MTEQPAPFGRRISDLARRHPDLVAVVFAGAGGDEEAVSWSELDRRANQVGRFLLAAGAGNGDRVALELRNGPELVLAILGAWKIGAVPVPMRWDLPAWERHRLLEVVDAALVVGPSSRLLESGSSLDGGPLPEVVGAQVNGICSSGSTGMPKVIISDRPAVHDPATYEPFPTPWGAVERPQTILVPAPLYHTNGFATLLSLVAGDTIVVMEKFDAARVVDLIERHRVSTFTATPTMLARIARVPGIGARDLTSIRWILQGAAVIPPTLVRTWIDLVGADHFFMAYGMTEGLGLTAIRGDEWLAHPGSVGRGIRETEVRILGPDGRPAPTGEIGEIYLRSPTGAFYAYLGGAPMLPRTADGFGTAGDLGWLDGDGYLYIADRRADLIISGGANVYPAEVESALADHPGIADVVVIGLEDPEWGRRVHAVIEPADRSDPPAPSAVIAYAKERLAAYKVPKTVEFVDRIPRSEATKVSRSALVAEREEQAAGRAPQGADTGA